MTIYTPLLGLMLGLIVLLFALTWHDRAQACRWILWGGLLAPMALTEQRLASELAAPSFSVRDVLRAVIPMISVIVAGLGSRASSRIPVSRLWPYAGFVLWAVLSSVWSVSPLATLAKAVLLSLQATILVMLYRRYDSHADALRGLVSVLLGLAVSAVVGATLNPELGWQASGSTTIVDRLWGVYPPIHPNTLALVAAFLLISIVTGHGPRWTTGLQGRGVTVLLALGVLLATRTRYALGVAVLVVVYVMFKKIRTSRAIAVGLPFVLIIVALGAVALSQTLSQFLVRGQGFEQLSTLTGRTVLWSRALDLVEIQPLQGFGYYAGHRIQISAMPGSGTELSNLDNMWIESLVDVGWIGTFFLLSFVAIAVFRTWGSNLPAETKLCLRVLVFAGLVASFVNPSIQTVGYAAIVWGGVLTVSLMEERNPGVGHDSDSNHDVVEEVANKPIHVAERR